MSYRGGGRGYNPNKGKGKGRESSSVKSSFIDDEGFITPQKAYPKRGGYLGASSSLKQNAKKTQTRDITQETLANIVAKKHIDTEYISKQFPMHVCYIEPEDLITIDPSLPDILKKKYMEPYSVCTLSGKPRKYYEAILEETDSVHCGHTMDIKDDPTSDITYSKAIIKRIIKPSSWGFKLSTSKTFEANDRTHYYNYWDYEKAFYHTFLYHNSKNKHTWFFKLCPQIISAGGVPAWFYDWWLIYGPIEDIIPEELLNAFKRWEVWHPLIRGKENLPYNHNIILFFIEYGIPWIWKWDVIVQQDKCLDMPSLQRVFWVRWWNNFLKEDLDPLVIQVNKQADAYFNKFQASHQEISSFLEKSTSINPFDILKNQIKSEFPNISESDLQKKCMDFFKDQFMDSFSKDSKDDSSMGSAAKEDDSASIIAGEAQDPYTDEPLNDDKMALFWDSIMDQRRRKKA